VCLVERKVELRSTNRMSDKRDHHNIQKDNCNPRTNYREISLLSLLREVLSTILEEIEREKVAEI